MAGHPSAGIPSFRQKPRRKDARQRYRWKNRYGRTGWEMTFGRPAEWQGHPDWPRMGQHLDNLLPKKTNQAQASPLPTDRVGPDDWRRWRTPRRSQDTTIDICKQGGPPWTIKGEAPHVGKGWTPRGSTPRNHTAWKACKLPSVLLSTRAREQ